MNVVEPIRDPDKLEAIAGWLRARSERDWLMFTVGVMTGLRISDILALRAGDVTGTHLRQRQRKTGKLVPLIIAPRLRAALNRYTADLAPERYLFASRNGENRPICRQQAYRIVRSACEAHGVSPTGTHTLRKTFGYHHYQAHRDVALLMRVFGHSAPSITLRYIGVEQDQLDASMTKMRLNVFG